MEKDGSVIPKHHWVTGKVKRMESLESEDLPVLITIDSTRDRGVRGLLYTRSLYPLDLCREGF